MRLKCDTSFVFLPVTWMGLGYIVYITLCWGTLIALAYILVYRRQNAALSGTLYACARSQATENTKINSNK